MRPEAAAKDVEPTSKVEGDFTLPSGTQSHKTGLAAAEAGCAA
jgi:hypothetical protein